MSDSVAEPTSTREKQAKIDILNDLINIFLVVMYINSLIFGLSVLAILALSDDTISQNHQYIHGKGYVPNWLQILALCSLVTTAFSFIILLVISLVKERVSYESGTDPNA